MTTGDHTLHLDSCGWDDRGNPLFHARCSCGNWSDLSGLSREHARILHGSHFDEVNAAEQAAKDPEVQFTMPVPSAGGARG